MITKTIETEWGSYQQNYNHGYPVHTDYFCIDAYETPENTDSWMNGLHKGLILRMIQHRVSTRLEVYLTL